ncbi:PqqD family protein [uncultured Roseobacter sp.]|uniref:PqqD family protein n=1 Tax=uncultured Roseobacter sp. TaxID=114847 RepID=UPI00262343AB|nr:PqqD family protein [uncultured Roseobacter sp.]
MSFERSYVAQPDVVDCDIGGDRALLHLQTNTYFTMNATASALWLALAEPKTVDDLVGVVVETFDVTAEQCRPDIEALLGQMIEANVVDVASAEVA